MIEPRKKTNTSKSLFRATSGRGRAAAPTLYDDLPVQRKPDADRRPHDFYPTGQPEAIRGLLERDGDVIRACGSVWEPAAMAPLSKRSGPPESPAAHPT